MTKSGKLYIDGLDAYNEYGVFVEQYGYKGLIQMPQFKESETTDWAEYDGEEIDLSNPVLDARTFSVQFCILNTNKTIKLFDALKKGAYHIFQFTEIEKTYKLRMTSNPSFSSFTKLGKLTLEFSDDFPSVPADDYYELGVSGVRQRGYKFDDIDFSQFGIYVLNGTDDSILKSADPKTNLTINTKSVAGVMYDDKEVNFKSKEVTLKLLIDAPSITEFWKRWNSFFNVVLKANTHTLHYKKLYLTYDCYYKRCTVSNFEKFASGKIWCEFQVVLTFISYHPYTLLATEDADYVVTEDNCYIITEDSEESE